MLDQDIKKAILKYGIGAVAALILSYIVDLEVFSFMQGYISFIKMLSVNISVVFIILIASKILESLISAKAHNKGDRYNLIRIIRLLSLALILIVLIPVIFRKPYASLVSVGLISLILSFSLQAPITSFIGWLYIVFRRPYQVGNRIQMKNFRGDVIEISYLDTVILEFSGDYLENDRLSGRTIRFPNSLILKEEVINYSGPQTPYIWNETAVQVAYTSDLEFVEKCLKQAAAEDFEEQYPALPAGEAARWQPDVYFRNNDYAWMEAVVSYPVEPADTTGRRNRILRKVLPMLNAEPDRIQFPEGTRR